MSGANDNIKAGARLGLTLGLGAWLGAPGYIAGGVLGSVLFPPDAPEAPDPYTALNQNTASEDANCPVHYGVNKVKGNWIYKGPLRSRKIEEGGKGGQKTVTGYKYWTWAALGLGHGIVDVSRMWKNDDIITPEGDSTINIYRGTPEQTRDPDWEIRAEDVVPLKRQAYIYFNRYYLGEDNNTFPTMSSEIHHFPWTTDMDGVAPYVLNKVSEQSIGGDTILRTKYDKILTFTNTEMKTYDAKWDLEKTLDLTPLNLPSFKGYWDACLTYNGNRTMVNIVMNDGISDNIWLIRYDVSKGNVDVEKTEVQRGNYTKELLYTDPSGITELRIRSNSQFIFISSYYQSARQVLHKVNLAGNTLLATYDFTSDFEIGSTADLEVNEDYVFWLNQGGKISSIDFDGNRLDTEAASASWSPEKLTALLGSQCIVGTTLGISGSPDYDRIQYLTYDRETGAFVSNASPDLDLGEDWWEGGASPFNMGIWEGRVVEGANGTLYLTGNDGASNYYTMELIFDANPAHIMYDLFTKAQGFDLAMVDTDQLEAVGEVCFDNRIGMSFSILRKQNVGAIIRDVLGHLQAHPYQTQEGKFGFFMPNPDDPIVDTIGEEDILMVKGDRGEDLSIITTSMKDIGLCPNRMNVIYENRLNQYKRDATFQLDDMLSRDLDGQLIEQNLNYQMFSNPAVISKMAWKAWKIGRFQTNVHVTVLNSRWLKIRHGEVYTLNLPDDNLNNVRCRVWSIQDAPTDSDAGVTVTWMMDDEYLTSYEEIDYDASISEDTSVGPPEEVAPLIWEEDARYNNDVHYLGLSAIRGSEATSYCDIFISTDAPDSFFYAKRLTQFGNVGDLVSDITKRDKKILVNTDNYLGSTFVEYTRTNQRNNLSYCLVGEVRDDFDLSLTDMEFLTYRNVNASGSDLELRHVVRGKDYTIPKPHTVSDETVVVHVGISYNKIEIPAEWIGKKIYIKFVPYNLRGDGIDFDEVDTYEYTIKGWTRKATHTDRLQIEDSSRGELGHRTITSDLDVKVIWEYTNRNDGMGKATLSAWEWQGWQAGDVDNYDVIIYQSDGVTVQAEHLGIGLVDNYTYTNTDNTTDFGGVPSDHFWIGIRPVVTGRGPGREGFDIVKQEIVRI